LGTGSNPENLSLLLSYRLNIKIDLHRWEF
jgi:hypothetical protein